MRAARLFALAISSLALICPLAGQADFPPESQKAAPFNPSEPPTALRDWSITAPAAVRPGDCVVVSFSPEDNTESATVALRNAEGKVVATAPAFATGSGSLVAIVALDSTAKPGLLHLEATALRNGMPIASVSPIAVEPRDFFNEDVALDEANTAIKTDVSPKRMSEIKRLNEILAARNPDAPRFTGPFLPPVSSTRRTSQYGDRRTYIYASGKRELSIHNGTDYGVPTGTPVYAAGGGRVVMARNRVSTGYTLVIEHCPGVYSLYYHCSKLLVGEGTIVAAGAEIARSGATGLATGPHLHHEYRVGGVAVSPDWFAGRKLF